MKKHAVLITVLFALIVTLVSVSVVFWEFFKQNKQHYISHIFAKHAIITQIYRQHQQKQNPQIMLEANLAVYEFVLEKDRKVIEDSQTRQIHFMNSKLDSLLDTYASPDNKDHGIMTVEEYKRRKKSFKFKRFRNIKSQIIY